MDEVFAEDVGNYWKTSRSGPDTWIERTKREIEKASGNVRREAFGRENTGRAAFMIEFALDGELFKIIWPVLPSKAGDDRAAKVQAATALYHDVKARCVSAKWIGARSAFFSYLELPNGQTAGQLATPELMTEIPEMFGPRQLRSGLD